MRYPRSAVAALVLSAASLVGIATHEAYRGEAYIPVPGDVPTLGYGATAGVRLGQKTTPERALIRLLADADEHARGVKSCIAVPLYQHEFDAYVSLAFNIGVGAFCGSTLVLLLNSGDYGGACKQILRWNRAGGRVLNGLVKRRQAEYKLCSEVK
jgi:lysozyme